MIIQLTDVKKQTNKQAEERKKQLKQEHNKNK